MDSFLKPAAIQTSSYIRDTTDFVKKIEEFKNNTSKIYDSYIVTMYVSSLYPNIDHGKGVTACREALERHTNRSVPSEVVSDLIAFILKSNIAASFTIKSKGPQWAHLWLLASQIYSCLSLKPILLQDNKKEYRRGPAMWIRYIDDVFFVWDNYQEELVHFLS